MYTFVVIVCICLIGIAVCGFIRYKAIREGLCLILIACATAILFCTAVVWGAAQEHGVQNLFSKSTGEVYFEITHSHKDNSQQVKRKLDKNNLEKCLLVFYRADCPDCQKSYTSFSNVFRDNHFGVPIYWINTRTDTGKDILSRVGVVTQVPSVVVFDNNNTTTFNNIFKENAVDYINKETLNTINQKLG